MKKKLVLFFALTVSVINYSQNTFPNNGNVGINTSNPSARLDVNGNMKIDSSLTVKDSLTVEKDMRTKGKFTVEDQAYFLQAVYMNDKLIVGTKVKAGENIIAGENVKAGNNVTASNNISADNNVNVGNKLNVSGNSTFNGNVKMSNLTGINNLNNPNIEFVLKAPNGNLETVTIDGLISLMEDKFYDPVICLTGDDILDPKWSNGVNKLFSACPQVKVGIATINPEFALHVVGTTYSLRLKIGNKTAPQTGLIDAFAMNNTWDLMSLGTKIGNQPEAVKFQVKNNGNVIITNSGSDPTLTLNNGTGHAIVFNDNNGNKILQIQNDGMMRSRYIKVDNDTWADYVFDEDYVLMPLSEVEKFIQSEGHLPNIPSAKEIENDGLNLGEMQSLQMEKIEEMYLHMIEMEKKIIQLSAELESLKSENSNPKSK